MTPNENNQHTQKSVLIFGLMLSPVLHVYYNLNVVNTLKTFLLEGILLIPREAVKYGSNSVCLFFAIFLKHIH